MSPRGLCGLQGGGMNCPPPWPRGHVSQSRGTGAQLKTELVSRWINPSPHGRAPRAKDNNRTLRGSSRGLAAVGIMKQNPRPNRTRVGCREPHRGRGHGMWCGLPCLGTYGGQACALRGWRRSLAVQPAHGQWLFRSPWGPVRHLCHVGSLEGSSQARVRKDPRVPHTARRGA